MNRFLVYYDPEGMEELCKLSPYNLKKDLKNISEDEIQRIAEDVANELYNGVQRPPVTSMMYWSRNRKAAYGKIRTVDVTKGNGKSNGYRCIALVDMVNYRAFILHLYKHGKNDKITQSEKKELANLVNKYVEALGV